MSNTDPNSQAPDLLVRGRGFDNTAGGKISLSSADAASRLISDLLWQSAGDPLAITYAFRRDGTPPDDGSSGFQRFSSQQMAVAEQALAAWASVANIHFVKVDDGDGYSNNASILFGDYLSGPAAGFTILPSSRSVTSAAGDVWINVGESYNASPVAGNYGALTLVHEIGHALGLQHPSDYDADTPLNFYSDAAYAEDTLRYTVMSYFFANHNLAAYEDGPYPFTPEIDDVAAVQRLFGANAATNAGNTVYGFNATVSEPWFDYGVTLRHNEAYALWDAGGTDTFDFSQSTLGISIDLRPGGVSTYWAGSTINIPNNVTIENAIGGSGENTIIGNAADNVLLGGKSTNHIYGEGGDDIITGGAATDYLDGGSGVNRIDGAGGTDFLLLAGSLFDYETKQGSDGSYTIVGHEVTDVVRNIEYVTLPQNKTYTLAAFLAATQKGGVSGNGHHNAAINDFDGNGSSDLLVEQADGRIVAWNIASPQAGNLPPGPYIPQLILGVQGSGLSVDPSWKFVATMDFNGDGHSDVVFRTPAGSVAIWAGGSSGAFDQHSYIGPAVGDEWAIAAAGDVNGDGKDDLIWRSRSNALEIWVSTGTGFVDMGAPAAPKPDPSWTLAAVADLNGDGRADAVWIKRDRSVSVWLGNGSGFEDGGSFARVADPAWTFQGTGDFDGNGKDDLLWSDGAGGLRTWLSDGVTFQRDAVVTTNAAATYGKQIVTIADVNHDGMADIVLRTTAAGAGWTNALISGSSGYVSTSTAADIASGSVVLPPVPAATRPLTRSAPSDFTGDGHSDILWRNVSGALSTWAVSGGVSGIQVQQGAYNGVVDPSWKVAETFDFDGDGRSDILWRQDGGAVAVWGSTGSGFSASTYYRPSPVPTSWRIAGAGDLNGDGKDDLIWQNVDGSLSGWTSTGSGFTEASYSHGSAGAGWTVEGLGDFNGDGKADILWRNIDGAVAVWSNNGSGTSFNEGAFYQPGVPTSWHVAGVGDFGGDGKDDILWRNDNGALTEWQSTGSLFNESVYTTSVPTSWHVASTGDFNADGKADILWQNDSGAVSTWQSNGTSFDQGVYNSNAPTGWAITAHHFAL